MSGITVIEVFRALGSVPSRHQSWAVGSRVAAAFRAEFDREPPKELRQKTKGAGSHCFAVYPSEWRPRIEREALAVLGGDERQGDLFGA